MIDQNKYYTISEVSELLGVNQMTVRRRIKKGDLQAIKEVGIYNQEQYFLPKKQFEYAEHVIEVLDVKKTYDLQHFALSLNAILENRENSMQTELKAKIEQINVELSDTLKSMSDQIKSIEDQNREILEQNKVLLEKLAKKKSIFSFFK